MYDKRIFGLKLGVSGSLPWEIIVRNADGESVISHGQDLVLLTYDTGSDLRVRVLGAHGGQKSDAHEILIPADVIFSLHILILPKYYVS